MRTFEGAFCEKYSVPQIVKMGADLNTGDHLEIWENKKRYEMISPEMGKRFSGLFGLPIETLFRNFNVNLFSLNEQMN